MFGKQRLITVAVTLGALVALKKFAPLSVKKHF